MISAFVKGLQLHAAVDKLHVDIENHLSWRELSRALESIESVAISQTSHKRLGRDTVTVWAVLPHFFRYWSEGRIELIPPDGKPSPHNM